MSNLSPASVLYDSSGNEKGVSANPVATYEHGGSISSGNSSTATIGASAQFTGTWEDISNEGSISVILTADQIGTLYAEFSTNGTDVDRTAQLSSGTDNPTGIHTLIPVAKYFRVRLVNNSGSTLTPRLQTMYHHNPRISQPVTRLAQAITDYTDVINTRSVIAGQTTGGGGGYVNVKVNPSGGIVADVSGSTVGITGTVPVSGTVTANLGTIDGVATETTLSSINTKTPSLGQAAMAASVPVAIASNQSAVPVSGTVTANLGTIDGVATETTLSAINTKTPSLGAAAKAAAVPVTVATDDNGTVSTSNSTATPLGIGATFTGTWEDVSQQASITLIVATDQAGTLSAEFSTDGTNIDRAVALSSGSDAPSGIHSLVPIAKYVRVKLVNGGTGQTYLRLQTILNRQAKMVLPVSRMAQAVGDYTDVLNTRAAVVGRYQATPSTLSDGSRSDLLLDSNGRLVTANAPAVRETTTSALSASQTWTSQTYDTINGQTYLAFSGFSATDLSIWWDESSDGVNWVAIEEAHVAAGEHNSDSHKLNARYGRIRVVNGLTSNAGGISNLFVSVSLDTQGLGYDISLVDQFGEYISADPQYGLRVSTPQDTDAFGATIAHARMSQIQANFGYPIANNDVTSTVTSTGTTTQSNGSALISTGTGTTSSAKLSSNTLLSYSPGREAYLMFTAAFTTPSSSASTQRFGLYDASNGFFIGYEGTSFGITQRQNGVDTFTPKTSFNGDTLSGGVTSDFTRGNEPEAIDFTKKNVFRIRFGWLGAASIRFEVLSPDGRWVKYHTIRYPNTSTSPSIQNTALPMVAEVTKTASDATNLIINTSSWDAGVVEAVGADLEYSGSITAANGAVTSNSKSKASVSISISGTWSGTLVIEGHNGDVSWTTLTAYTTANVPVTSTTTNQFLFVNCSAYAQVRVRASSWTSGTAVIQLTASDSLVSVFTQTEGNVPAASTDAGNPVKIGGLAKTTQPTAVTDGQRSNVLTDKLGRQVVVPGHIRDLVVQQATTITNSSAETTILTAAAGVFNDLTSLVITNASNQGLTVTIRDATGGTTRAIYYLAANGGLVFTPNVHWKQTTVNNNWTAQLSSATATVYFHVMAAQNI